MPYTDLGAPQSRNEVLLMNMLGAEYEVEEPQSRIEYLLKEILETGGGGSGEVKGVKGAVETEYRKGLVDLAITAIAYLAGGITYNEATKEIHGPQYDVLPTAAAIWENRVIQYVGADTTNRKCGHFYKCMDISGTLAWVDLNDTIEALTQEQLDALIALLN